MSHKYNVAPKAMRTWEGTVYGSKVEMEQAKVLRARLNGGDLRELREQVTVQLGEDIKTVVDFRIVDRDGDVEYIEVKGVETARFKMVRRLWRKYGPGPMRLVRCERGHLSTYEIIVPEPGRRLI